MLLNSGSQVDGESISDMPGEEPLPDADERCSSQYVSGVAPRPGATDVNEPAHAAIRQLMKALEQIGTGIASAGEAERALAQHARELRGLLAPFAPVAPLAPGEPNEHELQHRIVRLEEQLRTERRQAVADILRTLEQNDEFLTLLIEEHDSELKQAYRQRDEVFSQVARLKSGAPTSSPRATEERTDFKSEPPTTRRHSLGSQRIKTDPGLGNLPKVASPMARQASDEAPTARPPAMDLGDRLSEVQRQLVASNEMVDKLLLDKQRSLELIRRLQAQRDDAHRELLYAKKQALDGSAPTASAPQAQRPSSPQNERPTDPAPGFASAPPGTPRMPRWPADRADGAWDLGGALPAPPLSLGSALPRDRRHSQSPLLLPDPPPELSSAVLDATRSSSMEDWREPISAQAHSRPVLKPKPSLAERPLVTYSFRPDTASEAEHGEISLKPPRTPGS